MSEDRGQYWPVPRVGRCATCDHHHMTFDPEFGEDCACMLEDHETEGWFPGMHLDSCLFLIGDTREFEESCSAWLVHPDLAEEIEKLIEEANS